MRHYTSTEFAPFVVIRVVEDQTDDIICELVTHPTLTVVQTWQQADDYFMWVVNPDRHRTEGIVDSHIRVPISEMCIDRP